MSITAISLLASLSLAQPIAPAPDSAASPTADGTATPPPANVPGDIVVTATRRASSVQSTPISITAVGEAEIQ